MTRFSVCAARGGVWLALLACVLCAPAAADIYDLVLRQSSLAAPLYGTQFTFDNTNPSPPPEGDYLRDGFSPFLYLGAPIPHTPYPDELDETTDCKLYVSVATADYDDSRAAANPDEDPDRGTTGKMTGAEANIIDGNFVGGVKTLREGGGALEPCYFRGVSTWDDGAGGTLVVHYLLSIGFSDNGSTDWSAFSQTCALYYDFDDNGIPDGPVVDENDCTYSIRI